MDFGITGMKKADERLFVHFRSDERPFVERVLDWVWLSSHRYQAVLTPFLDPRQQWIAETLTRREPDLIFLADGGTEGAERKRAVIGPEALMTDPGFGLAFLRLKKARGGMLEHSDVLGALLGLGLKREKVGDIFPHEEGADVVVAEELLDFVSMQLTQVGREHVTVDVIERGELAVCKDRGEMRDISVASLRLDAVVAEGFRLSRAKAADLIRSGKCCLNWKLSDRPDELVGEGDVISLRGYGRACVESIGGISKKGRVRMKLEVFA
jgi:RNA-binding protein YlmH